MAMEKIERDPNWPEWAKYYARDQDGRAYVYESFPFKNQENTVWWCVPGSRMEYAGDWGLDVFKSCTDWQNSVREIASIDEKHVVHKDTKGHHSGDCDIYNLIYNENPWDGICTCGYGLSRRRDAVDFSHMLSDERTKLQIMINVEIGKEKS